MKKEKKYTRTPSERMLGIMIWSIVFVALTLHIQCRSIDMRRRSESYRSEEHARLQRTTSGMVYGHSDSTGLYWTFRSDSAFIYYPDSALMVRGGDLRVWRESRQHRFWQRDSVQENYQVERENRGVRQSTERRSLSRFWPIAGAILLVSLLLYLWVRYKCCK